MFSGFFIAYLECESNLEHFEKKDEDPSLVISEIIDSEISWLLKRLKGLASEHHSGKQRVNGYQTLLKSAQNHYYRIFP